LLQTQNLKLNAENCFLPQADDRHRSHQPPPRPWRERQMGTDGVLYAGNQSDGPAAAKVGDVVGEVEMTFEEGAPVRHPVGQ
jgi:hypothetical protein